MPSKPRLLSVLARGHLSLYVVADAARLCGRQQDILQNNRVTNMTANATHEIIINLVPSIAEIPASSPAELISETPFFDTAVAMALPTARDKAASVASAMLMTMVPLSMLGRLRVRTMMHDRKDRPEKALPSMYRTNTASRKLLR